MRIQAKKKVGKKFENISIDDLRDKPLVEYCADEFDHVTLAMYEDDEDVPNLIISNRLSDKAEYKPRGIIYYHVDEFQKLLVNRVCPNVVLNVIEGSSFIEAKSLEPKKEE